MRRVAPLLTVNLRLTSLPGIAFVLSMIAAVTATGLERVSVDHEHVAQMAKRRAAGPYQPSGKTAPRFFRELSYDDYRKITARPEMNLWRDAGLRFQLQFHHPGYLYAQTVRLNEFTETHSQSIPFSRNFFDYHDIDPPLFSRWGLDFAGFRLVYPLNDPNQWDEVVSFLGGSYFRALGKRQVFGASARGIAVNTGGPDPEEFPRFVEFWIRKPDTNATTIVVHALLDGPSVAGAYTFSITPGPETVVETRATLYFRRAVQATGLIPVTSMFWFGEGSANHFGDFRPEVHDSDGLLIAPDAKTRLWRPLNNPPGVTLTDYEAPEFAGFGLLQRDRTFRNYEDVEASYERRPGVWVEPQGKWPAGRVRLVELPTKDEYHDNVTVFWQPAQSIPPGEAFEIAWKQHWTFAPTFGGPSGWVSATRQTVHEGGPDRTKFVIDFDASSLASIPANAEVTVDASATNGATVAQSQLLRKDADGARRLVLVLQAPPGGTPVQASARLMLDGKPITETWTTRWQP